MSPRRDCSAKGAIYQPGTDVHDDANANLYPYDPDQAEALLEEAGVAGSLEFSVAAGSGATYERIATVQQQRLKEMGVTSSIELVTTAQSQAVYRDGTVDAMWTGVTQSLSPVSTMSNIAANALGDATIEAALNDLITRADAELDDNARWELLREAEHLVLDEVRVIPPCARAARHGSRPRTSRTLTRCRSSRRAYPTSWVSEFLRADRDRRHAQIIHASRNPRPGRHLGGEPGVRRLVFGGATRCRSGWSRLSTQTSDY